uniref:Stage iii sporulation protein d n=1 Tax=Actinobacteria phage HS02 TaxID=3056388 RepID=A0AA49X3W5_9VIRU|nr:MAG: stage iii sporulation protein d [Actinobacteria phage HS02]
MKGTHTDWYRRVTRGDSNRHVSSRANISDATLGRQLKANELSADLIIKIAQAYDESPVVALVDLGFISARWMQEVGTTTALTRATDEELTDELLRRLRLIEDEPIDHLAERRRKARMSNQFDSMPEGAVAYSGPDEDAERNDVDDD